MVSNPISGAWQKYRVRVIAIGVVILVAWIWLSGGSSSTRQEQIPDTYPTAGRELLLHTEKGVRTARPLVLVLADERMTAKQIESESKVSPYADDHDFSVAYLDGVGLHWDPDPGSRDPQFLVDVVRYAATKTKVDLRRVYLWGLAEGGAQALRTACEAKPGFFAAVATVGPVGPTPASCVHAPNISHQPGDSWASRTTKTFWTFSKDKQR